MQNLHFLAQNRPSNRNEMKNEKWKMENVLV